MSFIHFCNITQVLACIFIVVQCLLALNRMDKTTRHAIRISYVLLIGAAIGGIVAPFKEPDVLYALFAVGVAQYLWAERRMRNVDPGPAA